MKIAIIINSKRLTPALKQQLETSYLTEKYDINYDLFVIQPQELATVLEKLNYASYNACLIGGGDGTVNTAVKILKEGDLPLIILPLGTFNALAKSLNYPNDIDTVFSIIKNKKTKKIDLAYVNDMVFLNHAWLGSYYYILKLREKHKNFLGRSKLLKALFSTFFMFKHLPIYQFTIEVDKHPYCVKTCLIFISNNESSSQLINFGVRPLLATGLLDVNILNCHTRLQLLGAMFSLMFKGLKKSHYVKQFFVDELTILSSNKNVNIVLDGEIFKLSSPLHFSNQKNKLNVIMP